MQAPDAGDRHEPGALDGGTDGWIFTALLPLTTVILSAPVGGWCLDWLCPAGGCDEICRQNGWQQWRGSDYGGNDRGVRPTGEINSIFNVLQLKCGKCEEILER